MRKKKKKKAGDQTRISQSEAVDRAEQRGSGAIQAAMPNRVLYLLCTVEVGEIKIDIRRIIRSTICT